VAAVGRDAQHILLDFLPSSDTINAAGYCGTLDKLKETVYRKRPESMQHDMIMLHNSK
jgi:hypothetical protein